MKLTACSEEDLKCTTYSEPAWPRNWEKRTQDHSSFLYQMRTKSASVDYSFRTTVAEQMDNILSQAGPAQVPNVEITRTALCKGSGADNILGTGRGK